MTVLGPIAPEELGVAQMHEHVLCNMLPVTQNPDHMLDDERLAAGELAAFKAAGGGTMVDLTCRGMGRDPQAIKRVALASGINIVMGCGWYRQLYFGETVDRTRTSDLAADMVQDLLKGAGGTVVRAGIIGEIGTDRGYLTAGEERVFRAAARAQKLTGAAISTHAAGHSVGMEQLAILEEEGVDPRRVVIGHCDTYLNLEYHEAIMERGAYVEYDTFGVGDVDQDRRRLDLLAELLRRGHQSQILLSTDIGRRSKLHAYGGHGYDHLIVNILPALGRAGASNEQIHVMMVENPARVLPF